MSPNRVAILGASGYTGQELHRILTQHGGVELAHAMTARPDHTPPPPTIPTDPVLERLDIELLADVDGVFLCTPHGAAAPLARAALDQGCRVVDLSADFRLRDVDIYEQTYGQPHPAPDLLAEAVYGLTEWNRDAVADSRLIANPGCYPTSILLPLLPLLRNGLTDDSAPILADSKSGVSGAGKTPQDRTVYGHVAENFLAYGVGTHRHTPEIHQVAETDRIVFAPHLLPMFRGMLSTIYVTPAAGVDADTIRACLAEHYASAAFVQVFPHGQPETRRVQHTNQCHIAVAAAGPVVVLTSAIDNLGKGAASQAVQNMNLMLGRDESEGLV